MTKDVFQDIRAHTKLEKLSDEDKRLYDNVFRYPIKIAEVPISERLIKTNMLVEKNGIP